MSLDLWLVIAVDTGNKPYNLYLFDENITHNVNGMWQKAGVYEILYEGQGKKAGDVLEILKAGVKDMEEKPEEYKLLNPKNGWGSYEGALSFLKNFTTACEDYPNSFINLSR